MKVIVVGCGYWGKNLVRNFNDLGHLYGISDFNNVVATEFSKKFSVSSFTFEEACKSDADALILSVPAPLHADLAVKALKANKHVFVEKPLSMNLKEADKMIKESKKSKRILMVGHLIQYHPVFERLKKEIKKGLIGNVSFIQSNRRSLGKIRSQENVIWSFAPHDISMILSVAQSDVLKVSKFGEDIFQKDIFDTALINIEFKNGIKAIINTSWVSPIKDHSFTVTGDKGSLIFDDTKDWNEKLSFYRHKVTKKGSSEISIEGSEPRFIKVPQKEPLKEECKYFIEVIRGSKKQRTDGYEGREVVKILQKLN
jgi:UDP-2-acetamido-3-amino-2,3-dideoxy-glucuronate N-acetyltransferase